VITWNLGRPDWTSPGLNPIQRALARVDSEAITAECSIQ
jgi:hypothetical protein